MSSPLPENTYCSHCALPVKSSQRGSEALFCCVGCRLAHGIAGGDGGGASGFLEARLVVSAFLAMGVMTFSLVLYGETIFDAPEDASLAFIRNLGRIVLAVLSLPVLLLLGVPLIRGAVLDLKTGAVRMDGLIVIATFAAYGLSLHATITGSGEVYFETATMVLVLVTFGRHLEAHARSRGRDAAALLADCLPAFAHRLDDAGEEQDVNPMDLLVSDRVRVRPGEAIPADFTIERGQSDVGVAHLTGEEARRSVVVGDEVLAGSGNGTGQLEGRVVRPPSEGNLARIRRLLEAPLPTTRTTRLVDRLAGWLTWIAIIVAILGGTRQWFLHGAGEGIRTALSVLLVACPCALGLAIPLAYRTARAALARRGVLVREPVAFEVLPSIDTVLLDKTGTLTHPTLTTVHAAPHESAVMRTLLVGSGHALGRRVDDAPLLASTADLRIVPGHGVEAVVSGVAYRLGRPDWIPANARFENGLSAQLLTEDDATLVALSEGDRVTGLGRILHTLKPRAHEIMQRLKDRGLTLEILSGDRPEVVARLGEALGMRATGGLLPEDKLARIEALRLAGHRTLMVGDGINDAPALRHADVGVAMGTGTVSARAEAQIEILDDDVAGLERLFKGAMALRRCVRTNLAWTLAYNTTALILAGLGLLHPLVAVSAMIGSSLFVALRSWALLAFDPERTS